MLESGTLIDGKYKILSIIGRGGMSTVYLAINERSNKPWAVKEVRKEGRQDFEVVKQNLSAETEMLKKLSHKGLPSIVDVIDRIDDFLIVMDYVEGKTLQDILDEKGARTQEEVVDWALQICDVLKYLHEREHPIIYRDLKPSNIMIKSDGTVILIDFGTAREYKEKNMEDTTCLGTRGYAAPEQFGGRGQTDARTDIYCLGATMYHLVTGHNPSNPPYEMYPITKWRQELSTGLEKIILKCTKNNPDDRYRSAEELLYDLKHYKELDTKTLKTYRRRTAMCLGCFSLSFLLLLAGALSLGMGTSEKKKQYEYYVETAKKSAEQSTAEKLYEDAIRTDSSREEAWKALIELFYEDMIFDDREEQILMKLNLDTEQYLSNFHKKNGEAYANFCYEVGMLYRYYYTHEEKRQGNAVKWFQEVVRMPDSGEEVETMKKRAEIYMEIGNFSMQVQKARAEGTDEKMFGKFWKRLMELKEEDEKSPDRELMTLRLYREIAERITEYGIYFMEDGVETAEMIQILEDMKGKIRDGGMKDGRYGEEAESILRMIGNAEKGLKTDYGREAVTHELE